MHTVPVDLSPAASHGGDGAFRGLSMMERGETGDAKALFTDLKVFAERELQKPAEIGYFATSLPLLLVLEDDLDKT